MINFKRKQLTVAEQIAQMAFAHPHFELRRKKLKLKTKNLKGLKNSFSFNSAVWVGEVRPTEMSRLYTVKIEYKYPKHPSVTVISPKLELAEGKDRLPHIYSCGSLCLYTPKKGEWHSGLSIASTIVPWITFWLYYYEMWVITGEWLGDEVDPYHVKNL